MSPLTERKLLGEMVCKHEFEFGNESGEAWGKLKSTHLPLSLAVLRDSLLLKSERSQGIQSSVWIAHQNYLNSTSDDKTLLLVMGYSYEQIVLSMALHVTRFSCRHVIPVTTDSVWKCESENGAKIKEWWDALRSTTPQLPEWNTLVRTDNVISVKQESPSDVFKELRTWAMKRGCLKDVAIDSTGGTKPMDSGAAAFAAYYDLPAYYISTTAYSWTLRRPDPSSASYLPLDRPSATFSHATRQSLLDSFQSRDFSLVDRLCGELLEDIDAGGEFATYFTDRDRTGVRRVQSLANRSHDWLNQGYFQWSPSDGPDETAVAATDASDGTSRLQTVPSQINGFLVTKASNNVDPRAIIRELREQSRSGRWTLMMEYFVAEYYRIRCLMNRDLDGDTATLSEGSVRPENIREVITVGYGLAESLVDSMLWLPICRNRFPVATVGPVDVSDIVSKSVHAKVINALGWRAPDPDFLHSAQKQKISLLVPSLAIHREKDQQTETKLNVQFQHVRCRRHPVQAADEWLCNILKLRTPEESKPDEKQVLPALEGTIPTGDENALLVDIALNPHQSSPLAKIASRTKFCERFGLNGSWAALRHSITHVRVPVTTDMQKVATAAVDEYLPRLIEFYFRFASIPTDVDGNERVAEGESSKLPIDLDFADQSGWTTWMNLPEWKPANFAPWLGQSENVKKWLGLQL